MFDMLHTYTSIQVYTEAVIQRCFFKKGVLKNFIKFTENTCARVSF